MSEPTTDQRPAPPRIVILSVDGRRYGRGKSRRPLRQIACLALAKRPEARSVTARYQVTGESVTVRADD